jgi:hypothetical protein
MLKLCELRWRKRNTPSDILVGKVGSNYLWLRYKSGADIGPEDAAHDLPYATVYLTSRKPFDGPDVPENA